MSDVINIIPVMSILTFIAVYTAILLILHQNRNNIGFGPLFAFVGITVGFFNFLSVINILVEVFPGITYSLLSTALVSGVIATVLFIYLTEGREKTQELILAIITAEIITIIFPLVVSIYLRLDPENISLPSPYLLEYFDQTVIYSIASLISIICDSLFAIIFFQYSINRVPKKPSTVPIISIISLIGASIVDAFLFPVISGFLGMNWVEMIIHRLPRFIVVSIIYAVVFTVYTRHIKKNIYHHIGGRPSLSLLMRRRYVTIESFLAEKRRAEILLNLMSHDVNNILQVSVSALELIKGNHPSLCDTFPIRKLENSNRRLMKISHAISVIGGLQFVDNGMIFTEKIELVSMCRDICRKLQNEYTGVKVDFQEDMSKRLYIKFNPLMSEAIGEILENAVVHNDKKPDSEKRVSLLLKPEVNSNLKHVTIVIKDNGPGINNNLRDTLLNPLEHISKRTGIGYVMLKLAIDLSGGEYEIYTDEVGSRIEIKIPV